jgi:starch-binding outer membrane protein, SusD/RagB family
MAMKSKIYRALIPTLIAVISFSYFSCQDMLDPKPETALTPEQAYRNRFDADAAVLGIYGKFLALAEQHVILNELRADLMDVTTNADINLQQINYHTATETNPYASPKKYYELILYCNDVLQNFQIMYQESKLLEVEYNERYADILTLRSWLYLQLAIHWGEVPYITEPFQTVADLEDLASYPRLTLDEMITELIMVMESLPTLENYPTTSSLMTSAIGKSGSWSTRTFFINKKFFLGDLYLWRGEYLKAASAYKDVMMTPVTGVDFFDSYRIKWADVTTNNDLNVGYIRFKEQDYNSLIDNNTQGWKSMFIRPQDALFNSEWIWVLPFESQFKQGTPFINLFSNEAGSYLVKPAQQAIDMWDAQVQYNNFTFDQRGRFTYRSEGGEPVIKKFIYNYNPLSPLESNGKWFLTRAAVLHLRFAEAANRDGQEKIAWALLNTGINATYNATVADGDVSNIQNTFLPYPYDFDARNGQIPYYRGTWHRNTGIRGRAYLYPTTIADAADSVVTIENQLIEEAGLELAYEGHRWQDLLRIAIRRNDPAFIADKVYEKLYKAGRVAEADQARARLLAQDWFLPFKWE